MSQVSPSELRVNKGRGLFLIGIVCCKQIKTVAGKEVGEFHLVCGEKLHETLYVEAWRLQANKVSMLDNGHVVKIANLQLKALGENTKYQATSLELFGNIVQATTIETLQGDAVPQGMPSHMPLTPLKATQTFKHKAHQLCCAGIVMEIIRQSRANGPKYHIVILDEVKVRLSVWEESASVLENNTVKQGQVIIAERLQAQMGKDDTTELQTTKYTSNYRAARKSGTTHSRPQQEYWFCKEPVIQL